MGPRTLTKHRNVLQELDKENAIITHVPHDGGPAHFAVAACDWGARHEKSAIHLKPGSFSVKTVRNVAHTNCATSTRPAHLILEAKNFFAFKNRDIPSKCECSASRARPPRSDLVATR